MFSRLPGSKPFYYLLCSPSFPYKHLCNMHVSGLGIHPMEPSEIEPEKRSQWLMAKDGQVPQHYTPEHMCTQTCTHE